MEYIAWWILLGIFIISILGFIGLYGWNLCEKNKVFGVLFLTISLNIIGTFIGCMIMYKSQHPEFKFWKNLGNKIKKMFKFKRKNKKIAV